MVNDAMVRASHEVRMGRPTFLEREARVGRFVFLLAGFRVLDCLPERLSRGFRTGRLVEGLLFLSVSLLPLFWLKSNYGFEGLAIKERSKLVHGKTGNEIPTCELASAQAPNWPCPSSIPSRWT
jgi:hypothetical protein